MFYVTQSQKNDLRLQSHSVCSVQFTPADPPDVSGA